MTISGHEAAIEWVVRESVDELGREFSHRLRQVTAASSGDVPIALTGGTSAAAFYHSAAAGPGSLDRLQFYWSDERLVPLDHPDSNFGLAAAQLFHPAGIPAERQHPINTALPLDQGASDYARMLSAQVQRFPLILLGLGPDGHTASLLPGRDPYQDDAQLVRGVPGTTAHPHARITFTPQLINSAEQVWFLVTGAQKTWALHQLKLRTATPAKVPALAVDPSQTRITIFTNLSGI